MKKVLLQVERLKKILGASSKNSDEETQLYAMENEGILTSESTEIDWTYIKSNVENIQQMWTNIIIDLYQLNVNATDILNFSNLLDELTILVKDEKKVETLNAILNLYSIIPKFMEQFSNNTKLINVLNTKNTVLQTYFAVEQKKWGIMPAYIQTAQQSFMNVMNQTDETDTNKNTITKIYVMINELNNAVNIQSVEVYYIKYRQLMETLDLYQSNM